MAVTELQNIKCHFVTYRNNEDVWEIFQSRKFR